MVGLVDRGWWLHLHLLGLVHGGVRRIQRGEACVRVRQLLVVLEQERLVLAELGVGRGQRDGGEGLDRQEGGLLDLRILQSLVDLACSQRISCRKHTPCFVQIQGPLRWQVMVRTMSAS